MDGKFVESHLWLGMATSHQSITLLLPPILMIIGKSGYVCLLASLLLGLHVLTSGFPHPAPNQLIDI
jgi:hypothetical protein